MLQILSNYTYLYNKKMYTVIIDLQGNNMGIKPNSYDVAIKFQVRTQHHTLDSSEVIKKIKIVTK